MPLQSASSFSRSDSIRSAPVLNESGPFGWAPAPGKMNLGAGVLPNRPLKRN